MCRNPCSLESIIQESGGLRSWRWLQSCGSCCRGMSVLWGGGMAKCFLLKNTPTWFNSAF